MPPQRKGPSIDFHRVRREIAAAHVHRATHLPPWAPPCTIDLTVKELEKRTPDQLDLLAEDFERRGEAGEPYVANFASACQILAAEAVVIDAEICQSPTFRETLGLTLADRYRRFEISEDGVVELEAEVPPRLARVAAASRWNRGDG